MEVISLCKRYLRSTFFHSHFAKRNISCRRYIVSAGYIALAKRAYRAPSPTADNFI